MAQVTIKLAHSATIQLPHLREEELVAIASLNIFVRAGDQDIFPKGTNPLSADDGMFGVYNFAAPTVPIQNLFKIDLQGFTSPTNGQTATATEVSELETCGYDISAGLLYLMNSLINQQCIFELAWNPLLGTEGEFAVTDFVRIPQTVVPQCMTILPNGTFLVADDQVSTAGNGGDGNSADDTMDIYQFFPNFLTGGSYSVSPLYTFEFATPITQANTSRGYGLDNFKGKVYCTAYQGGGSGGVTQRRWILVVNWDARALIRRYTMSETTGLENNAIALPRAIMVNPFTLEIWLGENAAGSEIFQLIEPAVIDSEDYIGRSYLEGYNYLDNTNTGQEDTMSMNRARTFVAGPNQFINSSTLYGTSTSAGTNSKEANLALYAGILLAPDEFVPTGPVLYVSQVLDVPARGATPLSDQTLEARTIQQEEFFPLVEGQRYAVGVYATGAGAGTNAIHMMDKDDGDSSVSAARGEGPPTPLDPWTTQTITGNDGALSFGVVTLTADQILSITQSISKSLSFSITEPLSN